MQRITPMTIGIVLSLGAIVFFADGRTQAGPEPAAADRTAVGYAGTLLVQLRVADLDRSIAFYRDVLGFPLKVRNDELKWAKLDPGIPGVTIGVGEGPEVKGSGSLSLNIGVADIDAARAALTRRGVSFLGDTITLPDVVRLADFNDPDGNRIRLAQGLEKP